MRAPSIITPTTAPVAASMPALAARAGDGGAGSNRINRPPGTRSSNAGSTGTGEPLSTTITS